MPRLLLALALAGLVPLGPRATQPARSEGAFDFEAFHDTGEVQTTFEALAVRHPRWFRAGTLGLSYERRPIPLLAISDFDAPGTKRGMWVDGAIHGGELASAEPALALTEALRSSIAARDPPAWLERVVVYVVPVINVDGRRLSLRPPYPNQRHNLRPVDDDGDGRLDEDGPADLNGDGRATRIMGGRARALESLDSDGDGRCGEDPPGGIDLNRNFPVRRAQRPEAWRPEPEVAAIVAFWENHPEIALAFSYHTSANLLIHPPGTIRRSDSLRYERVTELYRTHVGGRVWNSSKATEGLVGTSMEWFHSERGAVAFTLEIELPGRSDEPARRRETVHHPCWGEVEVERIDEGFPSRAQTRMGRRLPELVAPHLDFLLAAGAALGSPLPLGQPR